MKTTRNFSGFVPKDFVQEQCAAASLEDEYPLWCRRCSPANFINSNSTGDFAETAFLHNGKQFQPEYLVFRKSLLDAFVSSVHLYISFYFENFQMCKTPINVLEGRTIVQQRDHYKSKLCSCCSFGYF